MYYFGCLVAAVIVTWLAVKAAKPVNRWFDRREEAKIVVGADYRASYTVKAANPWEPAEVKTWKVKVVDVAAGHVKYHHYRDDGVLVTHLFEVAPIYKFRMLYTLETGK